MKAIFFSKVFKNFSYLTLGSIVSQFLILITVIKITNELSPVDYGVYTFILSQGLLLHTLSDLGLQNIIIRSIARNPEKTNTIIINGSILRFLALLIFISTYLVYNNLLGNLNPTQIIFIGAYGITTSFYFLLEYVFVGNQKMLFPSILKIIQSSIWILTVFTLPAEYFNISNLLTIYLCISGIQILFMIITLKKLSLFSGKIEGFIKSSKSLVSESWPYITLMFLNLPFSHFANNFLDLNSTTDEIGFFNLAKKLMNPVQIIVAFSVTAIFPNISKLFSDNKERFLEIVKKGMPLFVLVIGYICFLYSMFSYEIISWLFTAEYLPAVRVAQLQIWFLFFNAINILITTVFGAANLEKKIFKISLICALIGTPLVYFGSYYGAIGMSYGFIIGFTLFEFYLWSQLKKNLNLEFANEKQIWVTILILFTISYVLPFAVVIVYKLIITLLLTCILIATFKGNYLAFAKK